MSRTWFARHGWLYRPLAWQGWLISLVAVAACLVEFVAVDRRSHSVSDTLYGFAPFALVAFLVLQWAGARLCEGDR